MSVMVPVTLIIALFCEAALIAMLVWSTLSRIVAFGPLGR